MPTYNWLTPPWIVQAEKGERGARPALGQRRWTDKDDILTDHVLEFDWPEIPKGVGADFEGERALRVFLEITDGPEQRPLAPEAILFAKLSGADAARAGLTKDDEFLVVPVKFFVWVAGALSFDKKVLLALPTPIMERRLTHKDAEEVWGEIVWITPMKKGDRKYYYSVLPLVGMGGVIDPRKGNPGLYAPIQPDPYRHLVWDVVDEVIDTGTSAWGTDAASGDGAASIFASKLRLVNFLRDLADKFQEEEFELMIEDGGFDRGEVHKAVSNGFGQHSPDSGKTLRKKWLERADEVDWERAERTAHTFRSYGIGGAVSAIARGVGEGWGDPLVEAKRRVGLVAVCTIGNYMWKAIVGELLGKDASWFAELAEKGLLEGDLFLEDADEIDKGHDLTLRSEELDELFKEWMRDFDKQVAYLRSRFPLPPV